MIDVDGPSTNAGLVIRGKGTGRVEIGPSDEFHVEPGAPTGSLTLNSWGVDFAASQNIYMNSNRIQEVGTPSSYNDAATAGYVQDATITMTNKTLTFPKIAAISDANGHTVLDLPAQANAVNHIYLGNHSAGNSPVFGVDGSDTNINLVLQSKGTGVLYVLRTNGHSTVQAGGGYNSGNVNLELNSQGTGVVNINGNPAIASVTGIPAVTGTPSSSNYLRGDGTWSAITAGDASTNTASSVDNEVALFSGTGGKTLKRASGSGIATLTSGVLGTVTAPSGTVVGTSDTQTLTSKTLTNPTINNYTEGVVSIGTVTTSHTLDLTNGTVQTATLTASTACTFTMPTAVAGKSFVLLLNQAAVTGNGTATFTSVKWNGAGAPTITATAGKMDILSFFSNGTSWYGSYTQGYTA